MMRGETLFILGHRVKCCGQLCPSEGVPCFALSSCFNIRFKDVYNISSIAYRKAYTYKIKLFANIQKLFATNNIYNYIYRF